MRSDFIILIPVFFCLLFGCRGQEQEPAPVSVPDTVQVPVPEKIIPLGCQGCHATVVLDKNHNITCTDCHQGNSDTNKKEVAHQGLIAAPAHPDQMSATCGQCHSDQLENCKESSHLTLRNEVNQIRTHFGIEQSLNGLTEIPESQADPPQNKEQLVNDLMRRRCLRCHLYTAGDHYPYVRRGVGCAACHLHYSGGKLESHSFILPKEYQCLSCHYGSHVGADFVGSYEHDYNWEYRTPYLPQTPFERPYGVEQHQLVPDIHKQRGLTCVDCHQKEELSGQQERVKCTHCHLLDEQSPENIPDNEEADNDERAEQDILLLSKDGKVRTIPTLKHPAHAKYKGRVTCQVCHAQWSFNDQTTHLMLSYSDDVDPWEWLTVQSSAWVEYFLDHNLYSDEDELDPSMRDSISGEMKPGIWYLGFGQRRWEDIPIRRDKDGIIKVFRPILDLYISAIDEDEAPLFDNLSGNNSGLLPYAPHTTGHAGLFYENRFRHLLDNDAQ